MRSPTELISPQAAGSLTNECSVPDADGQAITALVLQTQVRRLPVFSSETPKFFNSLITLAVHIPDVGDLVGAIQAVEGKAVYAASLTVVVGENGEPLAGGLVPDLDPAKASLKSFSEIYQIDLTEGPSYGFVLSRLRESMPSLYAKYAANGPSEDVNALIRQALAGGSPGESGCCGGACDS